MASNHLERDLKLLVRFVELYCRDHHGETERKPLILKGFESVLPDSLQLCGECSRLLGHALVKRSHCPMDPKPMCKHCPKHCYQPTYRKQIQEVMKYSGRKLVLSGRVDYLLHLFF